MRLRTLGLVALILAVLACMTVVQAQSSQTFTLQWNHDGAYTTGYSVIVDATAPVTLTYTCTGTGASRVCSSTVTLTLNVSHTVTVRATGLMGSADSDPLPLAPPSKPGVVVVKFP